MNLLASFLKNLIALIIGAAGAALILICINSAIEWYRGGNLPTQEKAILIVKKQELALKKRKLDSAIALEETKIAHIKANNGSKVKETYYTALKEIDKLKRRIVALDELEVDKELASTFSDCLARNSKNFFRYTVEIFFILLFFPVVISLVLYYGFARSVEGFRPIVADGCNGNSKNIVVSDSDVSADVELPEGRHLYLRGGWCKKKSGVNARTKLMWKWSAPLVTFAADLFELVDFSASGKTSGKITITSPEPDLFFSRIDLGEGSSIVIRPRHLIGVTDDVKIRTHWNFSLHNILAGKIRQIVLEGDGFILVSGSWGVSAATVKDDESKIESNLLVAYDAHASYSLCRTETWWHYFRKEASLFDVKIENGTFVTQNNSWCYSNKNATFIEKTITAFLNGVGSILGF